MGKNKNLKAALQSQQSRLKAKQKISHAAQVAEQKVQKNGKPQFRANAAPSAVSKGKGKALAAPPPRQTTIPFRSTDKILLVGEGNFSFARALICDAPSELHGLPLKNLTATAYDTEKECYDKYTDAEEIVTSLREKGVEILFGVDGTRLEKTTSLKGRKWDRVVWNFPHAGPPVLISYPWNH